MVYFTSDLHLGHTNVIKFQNRAFKDVEEMNKTLITNYNAVVNRNDICYILGDIAHHTPITTVNEMISKLNGKKFLIRGNHDKNYDESLFSGIYDVYETSFSIKDFNRHFVLMHYPLLSWHRANAGAIHLHGHIHSDGSYNKKNYDKHIFRYDVGVDANNYYPVSVEQIFNHFKDILDSPLEIHGIESDFDIYENSIDLSCK